MSSRATAYLQTVAVITISSSKAFSSTTDGSIVKNSLKEAYKKYQQVQRDAAYLLYGNINATITVRSIINLQGSLEKAQKSVPS